MSFQIVNSVTFKCIGTKYTTEFCLSKYRPCLAWQSVLVPIYTLTNSQVFLFHCMISNVKTMV